MPELQNSVIAMARPRCYGVLASKIYPNISGPHMQHILAAEERSLTDGPLTRDMPYDGLPDEDMVRSSVDGTELHVYNWHKSCDAPLRGVILLLHGVRAHLRLTWLAKRPALLEARGACLPRDLVAAIHHLDIKGDQSPSSVSTVGTSSEEDLPSYQSSPLEDRETKLFYDGSWIEAFNILGYEVFGFDLRGHGKSGGERCSVDDFDHYCSDVRDVIESVIWTRYDRSSVDLTVMAVSLSTLIVLTLLMKPEAQSLNIKDVALFSGFLKEGGKFGRFPMRAVLRSVRALRHVVPGMHIYMPANPETRGPDWQLKYGDADPYLVKDNFTFKMLGNCLIALSKFNQGKEEVLSNKACQRLLMFHNYNDAVNPIDGAMDCMNWLCANNPNDGMDIQCIVLNGHAASDEERTKWASNTDFVEEPMDLGHTLITDVDNVLVFQQLLQWLRSSPSDTHTCA